MAVVKLIALLSFALLDQSAAIISLVDDDPTVLKALARLLMSAGWQAKTFCDPEEFLLHARTHRTPVALLDVWMPTMNGLEVQSRLREVSPSTRVIIFTGKDDPVVRETAMKAGASGFFLKPFHDEELLTTIRLALAAMD
jgi:FixJ family two-component response regulator